MARPNDDNRIEARRRAKAHRDALLEQLAEAEKRGDSERVAILREEAARSDRSARGAA